jgi:predicted DNA-binding ribbon-helix-helix protein
LIPAGAAALPSKPARPKPLSSALRVYVTGYLHDHPLPLLKSRRIDIFGHQTSLAIEEEYWTWIAEIRSKYGLSLREFVEAVALTKSRGRPLVSAIRVAIAKFYHGGNPHEIYRCSAGLVPMRNGDVSMGWPGGRRRAREGPRSVLVDHAHGTRRPRSASRSASRFRRPDVAR